MMCRVFRSSLLAWLMLGLIVPSEGVNATESAKDCPWQDSSVCTCSANQAICYARGPRIPKPSNNLTQIDSLSISGYRLIEIGDDDLPPNLKKIEVKSLSFAYFSSNALRKSLKTLERFSVWSLNLTELPGSLREVEGLEGLELRHARIKTWNRNLTRHLGRTIKNLTLNVPLDKWPEWITDFVQLETLLLRTPHFEVPPDAFDHVQNTLKKLEFDGQFFYRYDFYPGPFVLPMFPEAVTKLQSLEMLSLERFNLSTVPDVGATFAGFGNTLHTLYLRACDLSVTPNLLLLSKLTKLRLSFNNLLNFRTDILPPTLQFIKCVRCHLIDIPDFSHFKNLTELSLDFNDFSTIRSTVFQGLENLKTLSLTKNKITSIENGTFLDTSSLDTLALSGNSLSHLPEAMAEAKSIQLLQMFGNFFTCSCISQDLNSWIRSIDTVRASVKICQEDNPDIVSFWRSDASLCRDDDPIVG
ncbi:leucine-rich repeat-containing G-protein coupled receptor 4 [Aplysia californica]|uniref:Leucine-rich repeat-containing G-protein coupled receptor 4 n=1 Tax=Aplysia californica TaxID=6500 RepID=A0ABM1A469_APLCA|nr:leucine-rich repeat-containing G-protein coupled receptor 4 [Aplysia californica]